MSAVDHSELDKFLKSLAGDHSDLDARWKSIEANSACQPKGATLRTYILKFRDAKPTVNEFVDAIALKLVNFCLPRKTVEEVQNTWVGLPPAKIQEAAERLRQRAVDLFKKANKKTNRNGEFGELIAYLLMESVLKAPQIIAKMNLKTNSQMPIHGSDGVHASFNSSNGSLNIFWGESKCYASVTKAIASAVESIADNLAHEKMEHELNLIRDNFDWPSLDGKRPANPS